ncbi:helicase associated domain-containing protein [Photobacterium leiognathi]|uniref:helicase associated domain-containing protein n=1 Tax=Photobacterium leiognathi TaxID=553611 RepID=UPI0029810469|nr:helicase associated domain-containing protein [Photobacterium leiognathi]
MKFPLEKEIKWQVKPALDLPMPEVSNDFKVSVENYVIWRSNRGCALSSEKGRKFSIEINNRYKKGLLHPHQISYLVANNYVFPKKDNRALRYSNLKKSRAFKALVEFKNIYGTTRVPLSWVSDDLIYLGLWVQELEQRIIDAEVPIDDINLLKSIDFFKKDQRSIDEVRDTLLDNDCFILFKAITDNFTRPLSKSFSKDYMDEFVWLKRLITIWENRPSLFSISDNHRLSRIDFKHLFKNITPKKSSINNLLVSRVLGMKPKEKQLIYKAVPTNASF